MPGRPGPLRERFEAKVDRSGGPAACHPWLGAKSKKRGGTRRGHIQFGGRGTPQVLAHVVALALKDAGEPLLYSDLIRFHPETGERLEACHSCSAPQGNCMNPDHLYWGTPEQNRRDRYGSRQQSA